MDKKITIIIIAVIMAVVAIGAFLGFICKYFYSRKLRADRFI